jgi:exodeoxyribonuclease VII large subunit
MEQRLAGAFNRRLQRDATRVSHLQQRLTMQSPGRTLAQADSNVTQLGERLVKAMQLSLRQRREQLEHSAQTLNVVSPLATLGRGYAIVHRQDGSIARRASDLGPGEAITARLAEGTIEADVTAIK